MLKVAVKIRQKLQSRDCIFLKIAVIFKKNCSHFSKFTIIFANFAVTFRILQSYFESCSHVTADFEKLQSHFESCSHVTADFEMCLQNVESCSHISNYDCNFQHFAVTFEICKRDCNFQHFAVTFRIMAATFNILQSHFEL